MKSILTLAALAAALATPTFAAVTVPDAGATAFLTVISAGALIITKNVMKRR